VLNVERQVQDLCFFDDGSRFLTCNDIVGRDSPDRTIMIWDFSTGAVLSNQIFHVSADFRCVGEIRRGLVVVFSSCQ